MSGRPIAVPVRRPEDDLVDARVSATTPRDGLVDNRFQLHDRRQPPTAAPRKHPVMVGLSLLVGGGTSAIRTWGISIAGL